jgi:molybdopterin converting factor small subunit
MKVIDKAQYVTKIYTIETDEQLYIVKMAQNDTYDDWNVQTEDGDEIDIDSKLGKQLIETCEQYDEDLGPEYDSTGFTEDDRIVNGQYRATLEQDEQRYENQHK